MPKSIWILLIAMTMSITGASFLWPLNAIIIHDELGKSLTTAGFILLLNSAAGAFGNLLGGRLFDGIGAYRTLVFGVSVASISACLLAFYHSYYFYMFLLMGIGFGSGIMAPALYALAGTLWPEGGRRPFNAIYVAQNVGVALGTALIGVIAMNELTAVFRASAFMHVALFLFVLIAFRKLEAKPTGKAIMKQTEKIPFKTHYRAHSLILISIAFVICWMGYTQWQANVSVHTQNLGMSLGSYSLFWTVNGLMIVCAQPLLSWVIKKWIHGIKAQMITGVILFILSFLVLSQAGQFAGFMTAMIILTIGEMFIWPAVPTVASQLAPPGKEGFYQGLVNSVAMVGRMFGPLLGGFIVDISSIYVLFYVLVAMLVLSLPFLYVYDFPLKKLNAASRQEP
ncbi:MDR family MFS transporter [Alkalicoccobacillus murimartini]|uniref:MFS family permease n=1 Tax=Alkalicoccobacillus murimartini TaxID=171685 RepID=A0ABT9YL50_9BACI|nr:MFS transporter [Alkalicoccobacillus murimartini]MDQ0208200.1 MFS family permease [Alkalicoccobacillus murimartini]